MKKKLIMCVLCLSMMLVNVSYVRAEYDYEPNESFNTAVKVSISRPLESTLLSSNDHDWYKFKAYFNGFITLQLTPQDVQDCDLMVMYEETKTMKTETRTIAKTNPHIDGTETITFPVTKGRYYHFVVFSNSNNFSESKYKVEAININKTKSAAYEENDSFETAYDVDLFEEKISATISSSDDVDYYKFNSQVTGNITLLFINPKDYDYNVIIYDNELRKTIGRSDTDCNVDEITFDVVSGREYVVIVHGAQSEDYSKYPYSITLNKSKIERD